MDGVAAGRGSVALSRRAFLRLSAAGVVTLYVGGRASVARALAEAIPGGTLNAAGIPKFAAPLLVPPAMPRAGKITVRGGRNIDYYEIAARQFQQQVLPAGLPLTTVWGYGPITAQGGGPLVFHAPSLTIEAKHGTPVRIKWVNDLVDPDGNYLSHLLPVDPTLHWANPPGGPDGRDSRPAFARTPGPYTGPVPLVTHVHGAEAVGDESDGYAEAWYLPAAVDIPDGYAREGTWYEFFRNKAASRYGVSWAPGSAIFQYPVSQRAGTTWYHDHTSGMTRLNVYAGPAGFFVTRGGPGDEVVDTRTGAAGVLPGPAPATGDPAGVVYREIPIAIQDRAFNSDGSLFYPDTRSFFDGVTGPYVPDGDIPPIWNPEFFGNCIMVNGNTWPFLDVEQARYRFRFLNGCNSRFLILDFAEIPGVQVWQIGNEGGFLAAPVNHTAVSGNRILLGPAERADVVVDFTGVPRGDWALLNVGPDEPFGGGTPGVDFPVADPATTGQVLQFRVAAATTADPSTPPEFLRLPALAALPTEGTVRPLALLEHMSAYAEDAPIEARLGTVTFPQGSGDPGTPTPKGWAEPITENPALGDTEVWEFYNATEDAHPMHVHEVLLQVVDRQDIVVDEEGGTVALAEHSVPVPAQPSESGFKDTVIAYPSQVTRVRLRFLSEGQYVWRCHIVEHEDNEMMRPYRIGPQQPGEPGPG